MLNTLQAVVDTTQVVQPYGAEAAYVEMLERVNAQLALTWTPLNTAIAMLGILFTIGAIAAGYLLYRQGQDHQRQIDRFISNASDLVADFLETSREQNEKVVKELRLQAEQAVSEEARKAYQQAAQDLEDRSRSIRVSPATASAIGRALLQDNQREEVARNRSTWVSRATVDPKVVADLKRYFDAASAREQDTGQK